MLRSLLNDWINILICYQLLFVVPNFPFWCFLRHSDNKKQKLRCKWAWETKKSWLVIILKDFIKQATIKQSLAILSFSFLIDCSMSVSSVFFYQSVCKYHWQAFTGYKNGENLKILIKVFCDKLIVSGVILAFLDHVKAKIFFVIQPWWLIYSTPSPSFENLWIRLCMFACYSIFLSLITSLISVCFVVIKSFFFMKKLLKSRNDSLLIYHLLLYSPMFCKTFILKNVISFSAQHTISY